MRRKLGCVALMSVLGAAPLASQQLGTIKFPTSAPANAQASFVRGVLFLHSFEYESAALAFRESQGIAPDFALAYWGEAMTYTHPVWNEQDVPKAREALTRLAPTPAARDQRREGPSGALRLGRRRRPL